MLMGEQDPDPGKNFATMKQGYPNCHGMILPDCEHYIALENSTEFNRAVRNFMAGIKVISILQTTLSPQLPGAELAT